VEHSDKEGRADRHYRSGDSGTEGKVGQHIPQITSQFSLDNPWRQTFLYVSELIITMSLN
jgi:hypothetical protein